MELARDLDHLQEQYESFSRLESEGLNPDSDDAGLLDDDTRHTWQALRMHPELRSLIMSLRHSSAPSFRERFEREGKASPFAHLTLHAAIKDPREVDPHWKTAFETLTVHARTVQPDEETARHAAEHALGLLFTRFMQAALSDDSSAKERLDTKSNAASAGSTSLAAWSKSLIRRSATTSSAAPIGHRESGQGMTPDSS